MKEIKKIIVPIDFLQHTEQIAEYAVYIADKMGAKLRFVHIVEPPPTYGDLDFPPFGALSNEVVKQAKEKMNQLVEKFKKSCSGCAGKIFEGDIIDSIMQYAEDESGDLIIIGTHGRKGLEKMWLGSIAERVIKKAPCPTLTCNPYKEKL